MLMRRCAVAAALCRARATTTALSLRMCSNKDSNKNSNNTSTSAADTEATPAAVRAQVYARDYRAVATPRGGMSQEKHDTLMNMWRSVSSEHCPVVNHAAHARTAGANGHTTPPQQQQQDDNAGNNKDSSSNDIATATFKDIRPAKPDESDEVKRKRLYYQSQYRGMVEMDLILGHFARCKLASLDAALLREYDVLLRQLDNDLFNWLVMGQTPPQEIAQLRCLGELRAFVANERKELLGHY